MSDDDLPMISLSNDSTQLELTPQKEAKVSPTVPTRPPAPEARKPAPAAAPAASDPRKASEARKPGSVTSSQPSAAASASRPAAPVVRAPIVSAHEGEDEDPEKLLREYADRQKTKMVRLEQQLVEYKKVVAERDAYRAKVDALGKELQEARRQLEGASKNDEIIKDLQGKVDAAVLSNSILSEDKEKLKKALSQQTDFLKKAEDRGGQSEKALVDVQQRLEDETEARESAESKVSAALVALRGNGAPAPKAAAEKPASEAPTRPMPAPTPAARPAAEEKAAHTPPPVKPAGGRPGAPPGRFSFLKK
ncbi:MAG TPA: hypothetical protein VE981_24265 [Planctomycetota bacterium]|nr:hypothetical protein [Planctomycetota bacterium]